MRSIFGPSLAAFVAILGLSHSVPAMAAPSVSGDLFKDMKWRLIGPYRGGRVLAAAGVQREPNTYYFGGVAGGVWRTVDGGVRWTPLTDSGLKLGQM